MELTDLQAKVQREAGRRDLLVEQLGAHTALRTVLGEKERVQRGAVLLVEALANAARTNICDSVTLLASSAIRDIFGSEAGCSLAYREIGERGAHVPEFTVWDNAGIEADPMGGSGGSAAQVIGTALRVFFLMQSRDLPFIFLDEPLDGVDDQNVERVATWFKQLCDELDLQLVMVTHLGKDVFEEAADQILVVEREGTVSEISCTTN